MPADPSALQTAQEDGAAGRSEPRRARNVEPAQHAGGMTVRDISGHLERTIGTDLSGDTISTITDGVVAEANPYVHRSIP